MKKTVSCVGCGRTQTLRESKIVPCDGYTCSLGSCRVNRGFRLPSVPDGCVVRLIFNAAGGFSGYQFRFGTAEELASIARAKLILANYRLRA